MQKFRVKGTQRIFQICAGLSVVAIASTACGSAASAGGSSSDGVTESTIQLGTTNGLTGPVASACKYNSEGSQAWFDKVNAKGGVHGRKIKVDVRDDGNEATRAVSNARKFMSEDVLAVYGGCGTPAASAIAPILSKNKVPYLFPYAAEKELYDPPSDYVFMTLPAYSTQSLAITKYAISHVKSKNPSVYAVICKVPGYQSAASNAKKATKAGGGKWLGVKFCTNGTSDYTPVALNVKSKHPDILTLQMGIADGARLIKALHAQNYIPKTIVAASAEAGKPFIEPGGYLAGKRLTVTSPIVAASSPDAKSCVNALKAAHVAVNSYALYACGTAQILVEALKRAGQNLTRDSLVKAVKSINHERVSPMFPPLTFSNKRHLGEHKMFVAHVQGKDLVTTGKLVQVVK